jgi:hypothetical protein
MGVPQVAQKERYTPGEDSILLNSPTIKENWHFLTPTKVATALPVWRRQSAQWQ